MSNFIMAHPLFSVMVIGSLLGTLITFIFPYYAKVYFCAGRGFRIGNLGLYAFIHDGWGHFIGNLLYIIPSSLMIEHLCHKTGCPLSLIFVIMLINALVGIIPVWFSDGLTICGLSSNAIMLLEMAFVWFGMLSERFRVVWFGVAIAEAVIIICTDSAQAKNYKFGHNLGLVLGAVFGFGFYYLFA
ncbi:hypothetical protein [Treponema zioleckii]|uniref:hypothetical protein n=1 Tax=Treponema zioleckii TaxID=331680 RepID=UPI00168A837F|nr:hypothetical protein [Treponema zioleckii]